MNKLKSLNFWVVVLLSVPILFTSCKKSNDETPDYKQFVAGSYTGKMIVTASGLVSDSIDVVVTKGTTDDEFVFTQTFEDGTKWTFKMYVDEQPVQNGLLLNIPEQTMNGRQVVGQNISTSIPANVLFTHKTSQEIINELILAIQYENTRFDYTIRQKQ